jgi:hypothetical protein
VELDEPKFLQFYSAEASALFSFARMVNHLIAPVPLLFRSRSSLISASQSFYRRVKFATGIVTVRMKTYEYTL